MARTADQSAKVKKLEANVKKLKAKLDAISKKQKIDSVASKKKLTDANTKWVTKVKDAEEKAYQKGLNEALKFAAEKQKAIDSAVAKFDKAWEKKNKKASKPKTAKKKKVAAPKADAK